MLTALELENFKGIGPRQRIELKPLTLLFGANSAGKSTILQALIYLHELIERGSTDVDRTELGGQVMELGGFSRLIHRHDKANAIVIRAEFLMGGGLEQFGRDLTKFPFPNLEDDITSAWIELTARQATVANRRVSLIDRAVIGVNGEPEPLVWLAAGPTFRGGEPLLARVNLGHPLIETEARELNAEWLTLDTFFDPEHVDLGDISVFEDGRALPVFALDRTRLSALPIASEPLRVIASDAVEDLQEELALLSTKPDSNYVYLRTEAVEFALASREASLRDVRTFLEMVVLGTTAQLGDFLRDALYIGPLRSIPSRGFLYERPGRTSSWADGLAAWEHLLSDRLTLVERTNAWLRKLGTGCKVMVQQLFDGTADAEALAENHVDYTVRRLLLDTGAGSFVLPSEVGAGISQVVPVVIAALVQNAGLTMVEQPELHVHPAVQVGLGDLFIEAIKQPGARRLVLVETHSEHLILRLLRRIRETQHAAEPHDGPRFSSDDLCVVHVEAFPDGVRVRRLHVDEDGEFVDRWPHGFFDERAKELF